MSSVVNLAQTSTKLYVGARVAVKTVQLIPGRRRFPGRVGSIERFVGFADKDGGFWFVKLDATKNRKERTDMFFGVDLEVIL